MMLRAREDFGSIIFREVIIMLCGHCGHIGIVSFFMKGLSLLPGGTEVLWMG